MFVNFDDVLAREHDRDRDRLMSDDTGRRTEYRKPNIHPKEFSSSASLWEPSQTSDHNLRVFSSQCNAPS